MPDKSLAERVAERLRDHNARRWSEFVRPEDDALADFVEAADEMRGDSSFVDECGAYGAALRRLAVALGMEEGE